MKQAGSGAQAPSVYSLIHAAGQVEARLEAALEPLGLSLAKYGVLERLHGAGDSLALTDLAARLACVRSNVTQLVDRLEADGLVRRVADPADRRSTRAELTRLGHTRQAAGAAALEKIQRDVASKVPEADRPALNRALHALG